MSGRTGSAMGSVAASPVALAACLIPTLVLGCGKPADAPVVVPPEIRGVWTTRDAPYADRAFEIGPRSIYFETGEGGFESHRIRELEVREAGGGRFYDLRFTGAAGPESFGFLHYVDDRDRATIRLENRERVQWHRDPSRSVPWIGTGVGAAVTPPRP